MNNDADSTSDKGNTDLFREAVIKRKKYLNQIKFEKHTPNEHDLDDQIKAYMNDRVSRSSNDFGIELKPYKQNIDNLTRESEHLECERSSLSRESQGGRSSLIMEFKNRKYTDSDDEM
jgi:hypothetical protein